MFSETSLVVCIFILPLPIFFKKILLSLWESSYHLPISQCQTLLWRNLCLWLERQPCFQALQASHVKAAPLEAISHPFSPDPPCFWFFNLSKIWMSAKHLSDYPTMPPFLTLSRPMCQLLLQLYCGILCTFLRCCNHPLHFFSSNSANIPELWFFQIGETLWSVFICHAGLYFKLYLLWRILYEVSMPLCPKLNTNSCSFWFWFPWNMWSPAN